MTTRRPWLRGWILAGACALAACQAPPPLDEATRDGPTGAAADRPQREVPPPDAGWRGHVLARCERTERMSDATRACLAMCYEFYREGSGSDGMIELELCLGRGLDHPLLLMTLGQLYLMAGQGEPRLLPVEGPAADVGDWSRNQRRLLGRARQLLERAGDQRPDDAAIDYLLADVARAAEDFALADRLERRGFAKCTGGRSFEILRRYQVLSRYPARLLAVPPPEYPPAALAAGHHGEVVLDLLLDPAGRIKQAVTVSSPAAELTDAARAAFGAGRYAAARIGKYPVWAWLRVKTAFNLETD